MPILLTHGLALLLLLVVPVLAQTQPVPKKFAPGIVEGQWIQPSKDYPARPIWGNAHGLRVSLYPDTGRPRGLLRIMTPYLHLTRDNLINFIAIEPIPKGGIRGYSELEMSRLDHVHGKRLWSMNNPNDLKPRRSWQPVQGTTSTIDGVKTLRVWIGVERFDNGAHVYLRLTFRADRPYQVGIAAFADKDCAPLKNCILTATMGNFARLRVLHLRDRTVSAGSIWPHFTGDQFAPHAYFPLSELVRDAAGDAVVTATPDETNPAAAKYAPDTKIWWHYTGIPARQFWRCPNPPSDLQVAVNGRCEYWGSHDALPGGIAFENFEMVTPFQQGAEFWFGVKPIKSARNTHNN